MEAKSPLRFRKLRIAWSVAWGLACVLLIVLWVRSYMQWDRIVIRLCGKHGVQISHVAGQSRLTVFKVHRQSFWQAFWQPDDTRYWYEKKSVEEWRMTSYPGNISTSPSFLIAQVPAGWGWTLRSPYWFIVSLVSMLAIAPWIRWRFTLRTLLIATTLISVGLGTIVLLSR